MPSLAKSGIQLQEISSQFTICPLFPSSLTVRPYGQVWLWISSNTRHPCSTFSEIRTPLSKGNSSWWDTFKLVTNELRVCSGLWGANVQPVHCSGAWRVFPVSHFVPAYKISLRSPGLQWSLINQNRIIRWCLFTENGHSLHPASLPTCSLLWICVNGFSFYAALTV